AAFRCSNATTTPRKTAARPRRGPRTGSPATVTRTAVAPKGGNFEAMSVLPRALIWQRVDTHGAEFTAFDDRRGLVARGAATCADPIPYACRYELVTDPDWVSTR